MTKSKWGPAQAPLFFLLSVLALLYFAAPAVAAGGTSLEVRSAAGKAGDTVGVTVSLRGLKNLSGVKGLSGCEFELHYDPATASIKKISKGSIAGSGFMFMENKKYSKNSAKVVMAAASGLITKDGDLCNITFELKKKGLVEVAIKELALYDQDVRALTVGGVSELPPGSPPGEGAGDLEPDQDTPAGGSGTAVELLPPGDTGSSPEGSSGEKGDAGEPAGERNGAAASSEKEPAGDSPAAVEEGGAPEDRPSRRWIWPAAGLAVLILAAAAFFYIRRRPGKQNNGEIE